MLPRLSIPLQLGLVVIGVTVAGHLLPLWLARGLYTFSLIFKELLGVLLPFVVFFFVITGMLSFRKNAPYVLGIMLVSMFLSNTIVALLSYVVMLCIGEHISCSNAFDGLVASQYVFEPLFTISVPAPISGVGALMVAVGGGLVLSMLHLPNVERVIKTGKVGVEFIITRCFIPLLPVYIIGFLLKIQREGIFSCLLEQYGSAFILIVALQFSYTLWLYLLACGFSLKDTWQAIKIALPSYITAFSTMSSTATLPVSIKSAEQNTGNYELAAISMPIMANIHLLGDCIATPILSLVTLQVFQGVLPGISQYIVFVFYFCITMFAASGIPGGGLIVMIPILESQLGFTSQMISVVMTIYFLMDCFGTGTNVMCDGAFAIILNKILKRLGLLDQDSA